MDLPQCVCRHENSSLYGVSAGRDSEIVLTIQDSGVQCFNVDRRENSSLWLLGDPNLTFTASAVLDPSSQTLSAAVCNTAASAQPTRRDTLLSWPADAPTGTLASTAQRSSLPARVHSLHPLFPSSVAEGAQAAPTADTALVSRRNSIAIVFQDGSASAAGSFQNGAGSETRAEHPDRSTVTACSFHEQLAVVYCSAASKDGRLHADVYRSQAGRLLLEDSLQLLVPSTGAFLTSASLQSNSLTTTWSTGALQVFSLRSSDSSLASPASSAQSEALLLSFRQLAVSCPSRPSQDQARVQAAAVDTPVSKQQHGSLPNGIVKDLADAPSSKSSKKHKKEKASSKKRKEAEAPSVAASLPEGSALLTSSSVAEGSVALASWESLPAQQQAATPATHQGGLRLSLFDACYGGVQRSQLIQGLQAPSATSHFQVAASHSGRSLAVQLDGAIYAARLQEASKASLASLVGCLAPGSTSEAGQAAQAVLSLPASSLAQQPHAAPAWHAAAPAATLSPDAAGVAVSVPSRWSPAPAADAPAIFRRAQQQFGGPQPSPAACSAAVLEMLHSVQASCLEIPSGLHARAVLTCAQAGCWQDVASLLQYQPLASLSLAPGLVPLLIAGGQHSQLAGLLPQARDLPADDIASALQSLLLLASAASAAPAVPSASSHTLQLRSRAEQAVSAAESCGPSPELPYLVASATVSAAALEGFSDQEVCLHPLVAMHHDSTVLLAALSQLSQRQAGQLLRYLLQWMRHHTGLLQHPAAAAAAATGTVQGTAIPEYRSILLWLGATLDTHLVALSMHSACHQVLEALQALTQQQLEGLDQLLGMRGMLEHIKCRAPLPTGQSMAVATYSIEVLDLTVL